MNNQTYYIYELIDPITNNTRYIGQSINCKNRYKKHISESKKCRFHNEVWINSLIKQNLKPILNIIDSCDISEIDNLEKFYINLYKSWGIDLTNISNGGQVHKSFSLETRQKISNTLKGKKQSEETKQKRIASLKKTYENPQLRELKRRQSIELNKLGLIGNKGRPSTKKGIKLAPEIILKTSIGLKKYYKNNKPHNFIDLNKEQIEEILYMYKIGISIYRIAKDFKLSRSVIYRILNNDK